MLTWQELQSDISTWAARNFGEVQPWQPLMGLIEEVGEFTSAYTPAESADALGDQGVYALNLCEKVGLDFGRDVVFGTGDLIDISEVWWALSLGCRAILKHSQGIRGYDFDKRKEAIQSSLQIWWQWAAIKARSSVHQDLHNIVAETWAEVRKRDWVKHPDSAHLEVNTP